MPINFTDYANIAPQAAPDLFGGLIEAYKKGKKFREESEAAEAQKKLVGLKTQGEELRLGALPEELEYAQWQRNFEKEHMPEERMEALQHMIRQRKNAELSGEHQAQVNKYYPRTTEAELENKGLMNAHQRQVNQFYPDKILSEIEAAKQKKESGVNNIRYFNSLPAAEKNSLMARFAGAGIPSEVVLEGLRQGKNFHEIAQENGVTPEQLKESAPSYAHTSVEIAKNRLQAGQIAELNIFDKKITDWSKKYARTYFGYSPAQIVDSFKGKNQDELAKYLAANALQPEMASLRAKVMGAEVGEGVLHTLMESALANNKILRSQVSPEIYEKMQHYLNELLNEGVKARNKASTRGYGNTSGAKRKYINPKTKEERYMTDEEARAMGALKMSDWVLAEDQPQSDWVLADDEQEQNNEAPMNNSLGFSGIGEDFLSGLSNIPGAALGALAELPGEIYGVGKQTIFDPKRLGRNALAGLGQGGHGTLSALGNIRDYLAKKEIIPQSSPSFRLPESILPKEFNYGNAIGLGERQPGDAFLQGAASAFPYAAGGELGALGTFGRIGARAGVQGAHAIGHNQNPITAAGMIPALEIPLRSISAGISKGASHYSPTEVAKRNLLKNYTPNEMETALKNQGIAKEMGLNLTPAEASHSSIGAQYQGALGTSPAGARTIYEHAKGQKNIQENAIGGLLNNINPRHENAHNEIRTISQDIITREKEALRKKAKPFYDAAEHETISHARLNALTKKDGNIENAFKEVINDPEYRRELNGYTANSVKVLDLVKRRLDAKITSALKEGNLDRARIIRDSKNDLVNFLDKSSDNYKHARSIYHDESPAIKKIEEGTIGEIANLNDRQVKNVAHKIFDPKQTDKKAFGKIRDEISNVDPEVWSRLIRNAMENKSSTKYEGKTGYHGTNFFNQVLADKRTFGQFHSALEGNHAAQNRMEAMRDIFKHLINEPTIKGAAAQAKSSLDVPRSSLQYAVEYMKNLMGGKYDKAASELITNGSWEKAFHDAMNKNGRKEQRTSMLKLLDHINKSGISRKNGKLDIVIPYSVASQNNQEGAQ